MNIGSHALFRHMPNNLIALGRAAAQNADHV